MSDRMTTDSTTEHYCFQNETYGGEFFTQLNTFRKTGLFCDVILVSLDGVEFPAHKTVLAAGSVYFNALFNINMAEKQQTHVDLRTVSSLALREILEYIYTGSVRVTKTSVVDIILTSAMFLLLDLTEYCWEVFVKTLDIRNCISRKVLADAVSSTSVSKTVNSFVLRNFVKLDLDSLAQCPARVLREVLSSEELVVDNELDVLRILLKWFTTCEQDGTNPQICEQLLRHVRFKFISLNEQELADFLESFGVVKELWSFNSVFEGDHDSTEARLSYRMIDIVMVVGGQGESSVFNQVCAYVPATDQWCELAALKHPRKSFGLVSSGNGGVFVVGGTMEKLAESPVSYIERYDARADTWEELHVTSSGELERDNASIVSLRDHHGDRIVIIGGFVLATGMVTSSVVELDLANGDWRELASLHVAREGHVAVVDDVSVYVIVGMNHSGYLASVERFDKETETWKVLAPMNNKRCHACAVWYNGYLYVFGGSDGLNVLSSVEVYDPKNDFWQLLPANMATPRMKFTVSLCREHAFVIGGMTGSRGPMTCDVEKYSFVTSTWSSVSSMTESKMELNSASCSLPYKFLKVM